MPSISISMMGLCNFDDPLYYIGFGESKLLRKIESFFEKFQISHLLIGSDQENMESTLRRRMSTPDSSQSPYPSTNRIFRSRFVGVLLKNNFYFSPAAASYPYWFSTSAVVNARSPCDFDEPLYI